MAEITMLKKKQHNRENRFSEGNSVKWDKRAGSNTKIKERR